MNKYEILGIVGEGAYGIVYKARNRETGEFVAIKKFKDSDEDEVVKKTSKREVKILKILKHENIVQLKEAMKRKGILFLVFEFVEKNLLEILEEKQCGLEIDVIKKLIYQLISAIDCCHKHNVIHRDIKPENLLINSDDNSLKICDFGFARIIPENFEKMTDYVATRWYRAPELLLQDNHYTKEIDYWAVGCILAEMIDGEPLFPGESEIDQLYLIQKTIGSLTNEQKELFNKNPRFLGYKFPDLNKVDSLEKRYFNKITKQGLNLLKSLLKMEPTERLSGYNALNHPFFEGLKAVMKIDELVQAKNDSTKNRSIAKPLNIFNVLGHHCNNFVKNEFANNNMAEIPIKHNIKDERSNSPPKKPIDLDFIRSIKPHKQNEIKTSSDHQMIFEANIRQRPIIKDHNGCNPNSNINQKSTPLKLNNNPYLQKPNNNIMPPSFGTCDLVPINNYTYVSINCNGNYNCNINILNGQKESKNILPIHKIENEINGSEEINSDKDNFTQDYQKADKSLKTSIKHLEINKFKEKGTCLDTRNINIDEIHTILSNEKNDNKRTECTNSNFKASNTKKTVEINKKLIIQKFLNSKMGHFPNSSQKNLSKNVKFKITKNQHQNENEIVKNLDENNERNIPFLEENKE